ncbi:MAG: CPBP family intramembrane glutamic endopeptidase [Bacteroidota bacterium]
MIDEITNTIFQIIALALIPFLVFVIGKRSIRGFFKYIGLYGANGKSCMVAIAVSIIAFIPFVIFAADDEFMRVMHDPESMTGKFREMGFSVLSLIILVMAAVLKTAFSEEILFRGFVAKRLISWLGFVKGNLIHAVIFGALHSLLFLIITDSIFYLSIIFIFPTLFAYINAYVNEKMANGSIVPGWISHSLANLSSYITFGFLL